MKAVVFLLSAALVSSGCIVVSLQPFYEETAIVADDRVLGEWVNSEDGVTATIERGEWRSYRVTYAHVVDSRRVTAYLFKAGERLFIDLTPIRGEDAGSLLLPLHGVARLEIAASGNELRAFGLDYDWFRDAMARKSLPANLGVAEAERGQIVIAAPRPSLAAWLAGLPADGPAWSDAAVFRKKTASALPAPPW